ncbi:glycine--tRNA ligase [Phytoactinopolyspora halotolerans]|uniref:Multifunctional fusion protein n=1 Tax=Phytoactinopolyspora halotolerans TaxID=1981512 RepID=A0A6L9SA42_9ACTN|nr:glycine--tRNA ligase [Phytoactinopolyspora halotolerans]NEE01967.1 glycine--tRNA ligase [Phytoactinopolyspora halotolerans]
MQDALLALTKYWTDRGCMIAQPFNTEVGAGTMNPATILRVLGPEPWRVAYVEPSVRPDDARYGENPNRLQTHTQFQVILKPDPGNPQEIYLSSLEALGIDVHAHDIRFVEDNWASPALGAWGLGWEVWLDGLEITQFTYFQQAGGISLDPVSVEITYGIERILMALQGVTHFKDIAYAPGVSYGEVFGQSEYEMSRYYLDDADVDANRALFDTYATEAQRLIELRLPVPAHTYVLKCSHVFNVLDARGAISTTERAQAFAKMRGLAREVAALWMARREELGHPLGTGAPSAPAEPLLLPEVSDAPPPAPEGSAPLLFEIGTEEMPPAEVTKTVEAVRASVTEKLAATRLDHGEIAVYGTPRRIVVTVADVEPREPDARRTVKGPRVSAAYDDEGRPTKALQGFARGQGVEIDQVSTAEFGGNEHVVVTVTDTGRTAPDVLSTLLSEVVSGLRSDKNMRWSDPSLSFTRPIRWLTALLGEAVVPVRVSGLTSGRTTRVHRTADEPVVNVPSAAGYLDFLAGHGIIADAVQRRTEIVDDARALAERVGGEVDIEGEAGLIDEITNLVEQPNSLLGNFDPKYLELPEQILTTVMRKHQRYLPVRGSTGALVPNFVAVANGACDAAVVRAGNEGVLRARYEDAAFFWRADLQVAPETFRSRLTQLTFEERIGSMAERADRIGAVATVLSGDVALSGDGAVSDDDATTLTRAAALAKFDLASQMVVELSSLAGVMAREYARRAGESEGVAQALFEMELPRHTADALPQTLPGALLALADRFDLVTAMFALGAKPTGSSDPFGLRRASLGIVRILRDRPELAVVTVERGLSVAAERLRAQGVEVSDDAVASAREFIVARFSQQLRDEGVPVDFVEAVLPGASAPGRAADELRVLRERADDGKFRELVTALQRIARIVPDGTAAEFDPARLSEPAETRLAEAVHALGDWSKGSVSAFADAGAMIVDPVNAFFDEILVMAEDPEVRAARLGLLATILARSPQTIDWAALDTALGQ